jgi:putative aldouronate transport system substrate-binding protein
MKKFLSAVLALVMTLALLGVPALAEPDLNQEVTIVQYIVGSEQPDLALVNEEMNKILKEKLNVKLELRLIDWGSYADRIKVIIASGEDYDLCFTSPWLNNYTDNVSKGAFLPLDDLLPKYAPKSYAAIPQKFWDAARVGNKIYGFLNYQIFARTDAMAFRKEFADKYKLDPAAYKTLEDIEPFLSAIAENEKAMIPIHIATSEGSQIVYNFLNYMGYEELSGHIPGAIRQDDPEGTVINQFADENYKKMFELMRKWYQAGYFRKDIATIADVTAERRAGKHAVETEGTYKPGGLSELSSMMNLTADDFIEVRFSEPYAATGGIIATMFGISRTCKNPERVMMYLEEINTNVELYNLMCYGIPGKHYTKDDKGFITLLNNGYMPLTDWEFGNQFNAYYRAGMAGNEWEETIEINANAKVSPLLGFAFEPSPVKNEIAQCQAVVAEYMPVLGTGTGDLETVYPEFLQRLDQAGAQVLIEEMQRQVDAWKAAS